MPIVLGIIALVAIIGGGVFFFSDNPSSTATVSTETEIARIDSEEVNSEEGAAAEPATQAESEVTTEPTNTAAPDEAEEPTNSPTQYSASASYLTPARTSHEIAVDLTVDSAGIVTAADVQYDGDAGFSNAHQERFDGVFSSQVVGQSLSDINLSRVGGASLTSEAFNEAVAKISAQV
jgi:pyruvate/2-oxoglutarate dehydrogenase complex dihydrolipoamide acyltransferase (E2) component